MRSVRTNDMVAKKATPRNDSPSLSYVYISFSSLSVSGTKRRIFMSTTSPYSIGWCLVNSRLRAVRFHTVKLEFVNFHVQFWNKSQTSKRKVERGKKSSLSKFGFWSLGAEESSFVGKRSVAMDSHCRMVGEGNRMNKRWENLDPALTIDQEFSMFQWKFGPSMQLLTKNC